MATDFMIDLETMSTKSNASIVSIGIAQFDREANVVDKFYTPVSLVSCQEAGLHVEQSTVEWWGQQDEAVKAHWDVVNPPTLAEALKATQDWLWTRAGGRKQVRPWGNGADFDMVITRSAYNALEAEEPWMFYNVRCFRTVKNLFVVPAGLEPARQGAHKADDDAIHQVAQLKAILSVHPGLKL